MEGGGTAELYRLKGALLLTHSAAPQAEAAICFHQALDIARRHEPEPPVAAAGQACRGLCPASANLRLVHRRVCYR